MKDCRIIHFVANAFNMGWILVKTDIMSDHELNYLFRGGSPHHVFEHGQTLVPEWKDREEYEVLIERVKAQKKPVASVVLHGDDKEKVWNIISNSVRHANRYTNEWGVDEALFTDMPNRTLGELAGSREWESDWDAKGNKERTVGSYVDSGFDMSSADNPVTRLESALLLGYPR